MWLSDRRAWCVALAIAAGVWIQAVSARQVPGSEPPAARGSQAPGETALIGRYCITCHNDRLRTAGLSLEGRSLQRIGDAPDVWEKVLRKVRTQAMPPAGMPRPDAAGYHALASLLETALDGAAAADPNPGRPAVHRRHRDE